MASNRTSLMHMAALWIIAVALALIVFFVIYSAIAGWAFMIWGKPFGFVRNVATESTRPGEQLPEIKPQNLVLLVGSGTVYNFLQEVVPTIFKRNDSNIPTCVLEGSTETGINLLSDSYLHGTREPAFPMLAMASARQAEGNFIPVGNKRFFEMQLGEDSLKVTFGALSAEDFQRAFNSGQKKLEDCVKMVRGMAAIRATDLLEWVWKDCRKPWKSQPQYTLYVTSAGSATRALFEEAFGKAAQNSGVCWPEDNLAFDLSVIRAIKNDKPWIALGSQLLDKGRISVLQRSGKALQLLVVDDKDSPISRGFYLYGRLCRPATQHADKAGNLTQEGYDIDQRTAKFLDDLFAALEEAPADKRIGDDMIAKQRRFLHLDKGAPTAAWIAEQAGSNKPVYIYRAE